MPVHRTRAIKSILTPQRAGALASGEFPFTHSLSPYVGCGFGHTACGRYCYARFMPNWALHAGGIAWGDEVWEKEHAGAVLYDTLRAMSAEKRAALRIFMASTTDPYQPIEAKAQVTRACLDAFARFDDLDLLMIQTRSPLASRDFDLMECIPYVWLSVTIETDDQSVISRLGGGPAVDARLKMVEAAIARGIAAQITVSPCMPYTDAFAERLVATGARRIVVDNFIEGDGSRGRRTADSPFAAAAWFDWRDRSLSRRLYEQLQDLHDDVAWSIDGFGDIPPRVQVPAQPTLL